MTCCCLTGHLAIATHGSFKLSESHDSAWISGEPCKGNIKLYQKYFSLEYLTVRSINNAFSTSHENLPPDSSAIVVSSILCSIYPFTQQPTRIPLGVICRCAMEPSFPRNCPRGLSPSRGRPNMAFMMPRPLYMERWFMTGACHLYLYGTCQRWISAAFE